MVWFNEPKQGKSVQRANTYKKLLTGSQLFPNKPFLLFTYTKQNHIHLIISRFFNKSDNLKKYIISKLKVLVAQSCSSLWDPMDCSLLGSSSMKFSRQEYWSG